MTVVGYALSAGGKVVQWRVENSWGDKVTDKGIQHMDDGFFSAFLAAQNVATSPPTTSTYSLLMARSYRVSSAMAEIPALIRVHARHQAEVEAHEAIFHVTVEGSSVFTGAAAFDKAKEIVRLVEAFAQHGFSREDFQLDGVRAEVSTGLLTRSSSAVYTLRIVCKKLERLPEALGELANAKQVTLDSLEWRFPDSAEQKAAWLARCVADAGVKARAIAAALPATIAGVHRVTEEGVDAIVSPPQAMMSYGGAPGASMMRAKHGPVDVGFPLTQRRTESVSIVVEYRIG